MNEKPPAHLRPWVVWLTLFCTIVSAFFQMTGPISSDVWSSKPVQYVSGVLSTYGWFFFLGFAMALLWELRSFLRRQLNKLWGGLVKAYAATLRFVLGPVLPNPVLPSGELRRLSDNRIKYGDRVLFRHFTTGYYLSSLQGQNNVGDLASGQQMTFGAPVPDEHSVWVLYPVCGQKLDKFMGKEINVGEVIRMQHESTKNFLHSHSSPSEWERKDLKIEAKIAQKLPYQREVTVSLHNNEQDHWHVDHGTLFAFNTKCRFRHNDGTEYLHSHFQLVRISGRGGCLEVTTNGLRNDDDLWVLSLATTSKEIVT